MPTSTNNYGDVRPSDMGRFWANVEFDTNGGCWLWSGRNTPGGYGVLTVCRDGKKTRLYAHRVALAQFVCAPGPKEVVDHLCRVTRCVNPAHLEAVSHGENLRRSPTSPHRRTHCNHGHLFNEANTGPKRKADGTLVRYCRECGRLRHAARRARTTTDGQKPD